ncbi:MAG: zf-HC2 domain-containing protein [Bryobacteraceae bacterium]
MTCRFQPLVVRYRAKSIAREEARRVELHLELCRDCRTLLLSSDWAPGPPEAETDQDLAFERLRSRVAAEFITNAPGQGRPATAGFTRLRWLIGLAGGMAAAIFSLRFL